MRIADRIADARNAIAAAGVRPQDAALDAEAPDGGVVAPVIWMEARATARRNAGANGPEARIDSRLGDLLATAADSGALIVPTPPYVASGDAPGLVPEVREHEPHVALF